MECKPRRFRPVPGDVLEDRAVPSATGLAGLLSEAGSIAARDAGQVSRAFHTFQQTYTQDVRAVLTPPGTVDPSANRPAFDLAVGAALSALDSAIDGIVGNLPGAASLEASIRSELLGGGSGTLQGQLAEVPTPASVAPGDLLTFRGAGSGLISQATTVVTQQVLKTSPASGVRTETVRSDLARVGASFRAFGRDYSVDLRTVLLTPGTVDPSANRPASDQAVGTALSALNSSIDDDLGDLPPALTSTLDATIRADLLAVPFGAGNDLQSRLAAQPSPTEVRGLSVRLFRTTSTVTTSLAQAQVASDIQIAIAQYNASLVSG